ncbi:hypothetical protein SAMN05443247_00026 [Bradyrhizobium erythrophlei]|nr:hypothetical protein SAMN05443247_00026 [Bradyrhizobium erythrophlei]
MISPFIVRSILNKASPALLEQIAEIRALRENLASSAKLAAPASIRSAYAAAVARSKAKPRLTIIEGGKKHE